MDGAAPCLEELGPIRPLRCLDGSQTPAPEAAPTQGAAGAGSVVRGWCSHVLTQERVPLAGV